MCWVPQGETAASLTLNMLPPGQAHGNIRAGDSVPSVVVLMFAVEEGSHAEAWQEHRLHVTGFAQPLTPRQRAIREEKLRRRREAIERKKKQQPGPRNP